MVRYKTSNLSWFEAESSALGHPFGLAICRKRSGFVHRMSIRQLELVGVDKSWAGGVRSGSLTCDSDSHFAMPEGLKSEGFSLSPALRKRTIRSRRVRAKSEFAQKLGSKIGGSPVEGYV